MRSGSNVTKTLLEFSSVWHGVCIYWNENIHSVKPCVTHVPHPSHCHPPPLPPEGVPPQIRGHSCSWEFLPQKWKNAGVPFLKTEKTQEGVPVSEGGLPENFEEREKRRLEPIKNGKNSGRGVPFWKGVYRKNLE